MAETGHWLCLPQVQTRAHLADVYMVLPSRGVDRTTLVTFPSIHRRSFRLTPDFVSFCDHFGSLIRYVISPI